MQKESSVTATESLSASENKTGSNNINVRLFLSLGIGKPQETSSLRPCKHVMRRLDLVTALQEDTKQLISYGGYIPYDSSNKAHNDDYLIKELQRLVKEQSGLDLSSVNKWTRLCTLEYDGSVPTVFFYPHLEGPSGLCMKKLIKRVEEEIEVTKEPEESNGKDVNQADEEGKTEQEKESQKLTETKIKVKEITVLSPVITTLASLHEFDLGKQVKPSNPNTVDLCAASDIFDEWLKFEFATSITKFLSSKKEEAKAKLDLLKQQQAEEIVRKRKREENALICKRRKEEKIAQLRSEWTQEDVGKTDEARNESERAREASLRELDKEEQRWLQELEGDNFQEQHLEEQKRMNGVRVQHDYDMFQFFDRSKNFESTSSALARDWLAQILLCLDQDFTYGECLQLVTMNGLEAKGSPLNYAELTAEEANETTDEQPVDTIMEETEN